MMLAVCRMCAQMFVTGDASKEVLETAVKSTENFRDSILTDYQNLLKINAELLTALEHMLGLWNEQGEFCHYDSASTRSEARAAVAKAKLIP